MNLEQRQQIWGGLALWLVLLITMAIYWPGLSGVFIYDDFTNLGKLSSISANPSWNDIAEFSLSSRAGPTRRPVSMASFALQAAYWPQPWFFKYTNLMLHLLNACLVAWLVVWLGRLMGWPWLQILLLSGLTTVSWLLNPVQVSTVLYVVQRMVELAALFTLAGLISYLYGRWLLTQQRILAGFLCISLGVGLGGILAVFSKENGILLPLYIFVLEFTLLRGLPKPRYWRIWAIVFIYLPLLGLLGYTVWTWEALSNTYATFREFTVAERLLTQPRVLFDYLSNILIPRPGSLSLFHDDFPVSTGLFTPWTTLPAIFGLLGALGLALAIRRAYPVAAFGILWFLAGHTLESSVLPLLMMFEHRNYLPMLGPLLATVYGLTWLYRQNQETRLARPALLLGTTAWLILMGLTVRSEAVMWSKPLEQILYWSEKQPLSRTVQFGAAVLLADSERPAAALPHFHRLVQVFPQETAPYAAWLDAACRHGEITPPDIDTVLAHFQASLNDSGFLIFINSLTDTYVNHQQQCAQLSSGVMGALLQTLIDNPNIKDFNKGAIYINYAKFLAYHQAYPQALKIADIVLEDSTRFGQVTNRLWLKIMRPIWLAEDGQYQAGIDYIARLRQELSSADIYLYGEYLDQLEHNIQQYLTGQETK